MSDYESGEAANTDHGRANYDRVLQDVLGDARAPVPELVIERDEIAALEKANESLERTNALLKEGMDLGQKLIPLLKQQVAKQTNTIESLGGLCREQKQAIDKLVQVNQELHASFVTLSARVADEQKALASLRGLQRENEDDLLRLSRRMDALSPRAATSNTRKAEVHP